MGQTWCRSAAGLTHVCPRSESGLEQICFCDGIHACLSPDSDMSMSKRNMHHVWTRSEIGKILRCSDLVSKFLLDRFPLTKTSKRLRGRSIQGPKNSFDQFFFANFGVSKCDHQIEDWVWGWEFCQNVTKVSRSQKMPKNF